jgi:NADH-quinone oxidoreductase subunit I
MGAAATYFRHLKEAVTSIFDGMAVSASHLIRRPYTIQYPDRIPVRVQDTLPFRYRGILDVDMEICTGCLACDRACPIDCIAIAIEKNAQTREIVISQFDIDIAKCMYCGLCSEVCPTGSIHHTTEFEGADFSLESLIRRFITEPVVAYKAKKGPEPDPNVASLLDRGMKYVDEWAQPGSDKPPPGKSAPLAAKPATAGSKPVAAGPATAGPRPAAPAATPVAPNPSPTPRPAAAASSSNPKESSAAGPSSSVLTPAASSPATANESPTSDATAAAPPSDASATAPADSPPSDATPGSENDKG